MTLNCLKLGRAVTFMKYLAGVVSLIFLPKTLTWNKMTFPTSNLQNFAELVKNGLTKSISKKDLSILLFLSNISLLIVKILRAYNKGIRKLYKNPHWYNLLLIMNCQSSNFGREGS